MYFNPAYRNIVRFSRCSDSLAKYTSTNHIFQIVLSKIACKVEKEYEAQIWSYYMIHNT